MFLAVVVFGNYYVNRQLLEFILVNIRYLGDKSQFLFWNDFLFSSFILYFLSKDFTLLKLYEQIAK